jgi:hypothetical protein
MEYDYAHRPPDDVALHSRHSIPAIFRSIFSHSAWWVLSSEAQRWG